MEEKMSDIIKIGIVNCATGVHIAKKTIGNFDIINDDLEILRNEVLRVLKRMTRWFDEKDTSFKGSSLWKHWEKTGVIDKFIEVINGECSQVFESIVVFDISRSSGIEHELYVKRIEKESL